MWVVIIVPGYTRGMQLDKTKIAEREQEWSLALLQIIYL